jgi:PAS domain S-box-containing protein
LSVTERVVAPHTIVNGVRVMAGLYGEMDWTWITAALSIVVLLAYFVISLNWYFQRKLQCPEVCAAALAHLRTIFTVCAAGGYCFYALDAHWVLWRAYDVVLFALAVHAWSFVVRTKGLSLVNARLARVAELERSCEKYREMSDLLPNVVWTATSEGRIDFVNERWRDFAGAEGTWLDAVHPDERAEVEDWWRAAAGAGKPARREVRLGGKAGYRTFVVNANPIVSGDAVRWLGACTDIEDQKRLAKEKEEQAKQKLFFLNSLSHDLRAPLNNVSLNAQMLQFQENHEDVVATSKCISENAMLAGEMLSELLDLARMGMTDKNDEAVVALRQVVEHVARRLEPVARQKGLYVRVSEGADVEVLVDQLKLERIVSNLVDNGIKYTESGGVDVAVRVRDGEALISVSDTGIGVPAESIPYLFNEFYQAGNHARDSSKGFGLGLAICRNLVRQLGGEIRLASTGKGGSCFEVCLGKERTRRGGRPHGAEGGERDPEARRVHDHGSGHGVRGVAGAPA